MKYLGVKIDDHLTWKTHIVGIPAKLNKANSMLSKIRHYIDQKTLPFYIGNIFTLFLFGLGTEFKLYKTTIYLTKKALRLMFFLGRDAHTNPPFMDYNILRFHDKIALENSILIYKSFKHELPQPFNSRFGLSSNFHTHNTRWSNLGCLNAPSHKTKLYGRNSVCISVVFTCNYLQNLHKNILFHKLTTNSLKKLLTLHFFQKI